MRKGETKDGVGIQMEEKKRGKPKKVLDLSDEENFKSVDSITIDKKEKCNKCMWIKGKK